VTLTHDDTLDLALLRQGQASNLVADGVYEYVYDAWNPCTRCGPHRRSIHYGGAGFRPTPVGGRAVPCHGMSSLRRYDRAATRPGAGKRAGLTYLRETRPLSSLPHRAAQDSNLQPSVP
jgi:hypothetical protein